MGLDWVRVEVLGSELRWGWGLGSRFWGWGYEAGLWGWAVG